MLNRYRKSISKVMNSIAIYLDKAGLKPWIISLSGLIFTTLGLLILIYFGSSSMDFYLLLISLGALMDGLDGSLARLQGRTSKWGAFYDSFIDRLVEILIIFGLLYVNIINNIIAFLYISTSLLISYARARGEGLGISLEGVGIMERAERMLMLIIFLLAWVIMKYDFNIIASILIILNTVTILQRILYIYDNIE